MTAREHRWQLQQRWDHKQRRDLKHRRGQRWHAWKRPHLALRRVAAASLVTASPATAWRGQPQRRQWRWLAVATAVLLVSTACGMGSDDSATDSSDDSGFAITESQSSISNSSDDSFEMDDEDMGMADSDMAASGERREVKLAAGSDDATEQESGGDALAGGAPNTPVDFGRDIIKTAWIEVESADVAAAAAQATQIIQSLGGITFGQQTSTREHVYTTLTFKVRPAQFDDALARLSGLGELVDQTVSAEDVTGIVVDLNSRIATAEVSVDRLREFLSRATDAEGVAELERELSARETSLEQLRGQIRTLRDQVDLATITLSISESVEAVPETAVTLRAWLAADDDDPCLGFTDLAVPAQSDVNFCFELENIGETTLTEVTLSSDALRFAIDDLTDPVSPRLEPGARTVSRLTEAVVDGRIAGRVATRGLQIDVRLRALPVADDGTELPRLARMESLHLYVEEDDSPPSFGDALRGGWSALVAIGTGVLLVAGAMLPFLPVIAIALWVARWWLRRRRRAVRPPLDMTTLAPNMTPETEIETDPDPDPEPDTAPETEIEPEIDDKHDPDDKHHPDSTANSDDDPTPNNKSN